MSLEDKGGAQEDDSTQDHEQGQESGGIFSEISKWIDLALECNEAIAEHAIEQISHPERQIDVMFNSMAAYMESLLSSDPSCLHKFFDNRLELMQDQLSLMQSACDRLLGEKVEPVIRPSINDRRFIDDAWTENPIFDFIKQSYLLNHQALFKMVDELNLSEDNKSRVEFYLRQLSSALSPSNFPLSNPEVVRGIQETKGASLAQGIKQYIEDQKRSGAFLNVCMSNTSSFKVGETLAYTEGSVVFENALFQLIQYAPITAKQYREPLLFVPSWVNKYYIFDLREKNSLVHWALAEGMPVFMISWVNPDASHRHYGFEEYLQAGLLEAIEQVKEISQSDSVHCAGYCLGGALLASGAAYLCSKQDASICSVTYLASSFDYTDPGDMRVLLDDYVVSGVNNLVETEGYFDGRSLAVTFSMLRENELYWNYYIQNYLKGERPSGFDILHWNSDSTNLTEAMHAFVLNKLVKGNMFVKKKGFNLLGRRVKLSDINVPIYILATEKDHIAKWESCYAGVKRHSEDVRFVLSGSGHIAGVINPASGSKYYYYTNNQNPDEAEDWLDGAFQHQGSWWPDWKRWLLKNSAEQDEGLAQRDAITIDDERVIEAAPGRYVQRRLDVDEKTASLNALLPQPSRRAA